MAIPRPETAKYLYSPTNKNVVGNSANKRRLQPWLIPCNRPDASDILGHPVVSAAGAGQGQETQTPEPEANVATADGYAALIAQVKFSEDKAELKHIGADLGLTDLTKAMKLETIKEHILARIEEIKAIK